MSADRAGRVSRLRLAVPVSVAVLAVTDSLAGAGAAGAAAGPAGAAVATGVISTVAGGVGGLAPATKVSLNSPGSFLCGVSFGGGDLYVGAGFAMREVNPHTGWLTTPAGTGVAGPLGDGKEATAASLNFACLTAVDSAGNLVIADASNLRVRVIAKSSGTFYGQPMTIRHIYTVAGDGRRGFSGDTGPATSAELNSPRSVAVDGAGNLVIADAGNNRVRVVAESSGTFYGQAMTAGHIYTVAGNGAQGFAGDGGPATSAELAYADTVAVDGAGNLVIADSGNDRVRVVADSSGTFYGQAMTAGDIYTVAGNGTQGFAGDGGPATSAELAYAESASVDGAGNLVIADTGNYRIRVVAKSSGTFYGQAMTAGHIYTVAGNGSDGFSGDGGPASSAELNTPESVTVDGAGNLVIADSGNERVRVVADSSGTFYGQAMTAGDIYTAVGNGNYLLSGDNGAATKAQFYEPTSVAADRAGNLVIADTYNGLIRVVAAASGTFYQKVMTAGHVYRVAGGGTNSLSNAVPATSAKLFNPLGVAVDGAGNLVIADSYDNRVRVVAESSGTLYGRTMTAGHIYTVAGDRNSGFSGDGGPATSAGLADPTAVTHDSAGNLVIADSSDNRVRVVAESSGTFYGQAMTAGDIYTVAGDGTRGFAGDGGLASTAELAGPDGVAADGAGNLVIADGGNSRVRVMAKSSGTFYGQAMTAGHIYTVAGNGSYGFSGDGGPATSAGIASPAGVAVDGAGNLVIADEPDSRIRVVAKSSGTFYGQAMTAGDIYTVAGNGRYGFSGDGGPATGAGLYNPSGVAVDGGNLVISDTNHNRIRIIGG